AIPFQTYPPERILDGMLVCRLLDLSNSFGKSIDRLIALKFPAYLIPHPCKILWVLHQYRQAYELWGNPTFGDLELSAQGSQIRETIIRADNHAFAEARAIFSNSRNVARRLQKFNQVESKPLYHPPQNSELFYCQLEESYFFFPSRMNAIKRQNLILDALAQTKNPVKIVFSGNPEGNFGNVLDHKIKTLNLESRVHFVGHISNQEKLDYYAKSLAVIYPPFEEDYGYVTLEAMLSSKAVITCQDSGGPLEFVRHRETGLVAEPNPLDLANAMDELWENRTWAAQLGRSGLDFYQSLNITWSNAVNQLVMA
ncbi:MAG: glycosyltransferase family 4 protein, partial [Planktothrix sp.]